MQDITVELNQIGEDSLELDEIRCNGRRIGFLPHCEGAVARFVRLLSPAEQQAVRQKCAELREAAGRPAISTDTMQPPDPAEIRAYERKRKAKA